MCVCIVVLLLPSLSLLCFRGACADHQAQHMQQAIGEIRHQFTRQVQAIVDDELDSMRTQGESACYTAEAALDATQHARDMVIALRGPSGVPPVDSQSLLSNQGPPTREHSMRSTHTHSTYNW